MSNSSKLIFLLLIVLLVLGGAALAYLAGQSALAPAPGETAVMTVPIPTAEPLPAEVPEPFAQVDPAIVGALERPEVRPLESFGGQVVPVGAWLPSAGALPFSLPTAAPRPTRTAAPTSAPTLTATPAGTATPTPTRWPTPKPIVPLAQPTATPPLVEGLLPPGGMWIESLGAFVQSDCAPSGMPLGGPLTQRFHSGHIGIDIGIPIGTPITATHTGQVLFAGWSDKGYGNLVIVRNGRFTTYYGHIDWDAFNVQAGDWVLAGTVLAWSGNTGNSSGPHIHYETRIDDVPVDPLTFEARGLPHC